MARCSLSHLAPVVALAALVAGCPGQSLLGVGDDASASNLPGPTWRNDGSVAGGDGATPPPGSSPSAGDAAGSADAMGAIGGDRPLEAEDGQLAAPFFAANGAVSQDVSTNDPSAGGRLALGFTVAAAGSYRIEALVDAPSTAANSVFLNIDAEPDATMIWDVPPTQGPQWRTVSWRGNGTHDAPEHAPKRFELDAGAHTLIVRGREPGMLLDRFKIVTAASPAAPPTVDAGVADAGLVDAGAVSPPPTTARDQHWAAKGYTLFWHNTPTAQDLGGHVESYFRNSWNNGQPFMRYKEDSAAGSVSFAKAPDGSPSLKGVINKGANDLILHVIGNQFGPVGPEKQLVAAMEWFNPCQGGQSSNGQSGTYIGFGHIWGSADHVTHYPGGSTNYDDAWSVRVALSTSNLYSLYAYIPDKSKPQGRSFFTDDKPTCGGWTLLELEMIQNDVGHKNAVLRLFIDGKLEREASGTQTRTKATVRPKGSGILIKHNAGAPQQETYYLRNWKLYVK